MPHVDLLSQNSVLNLIFKTQSEFMSHVSMCVVYLCVCLSV